MKLFDNLIKSSKINDIKSFFVDNKNSSQLNDRIECKKCNSIVDKDSKYCRKCGNKLKNEESKNNVNDKETEEIEEIETKVDYKLPSENIIMDERIKQIFKNAKGIFEVNIPLGTNEKDEMLYCDIVKMPNLLIGGTVMSGKTNFLNIALCNILMNYSPQDVKMIIVDSKGVDYSCYNVVPHLLCPVIKDPIKLKMALNNEVEEMKRRYAILNKNGFKKVSDYNSKNENLKLPYHLIFIDDYTVFANDEDNMFIEQLATGGWSVGIHLLMVVNHPTIKILSAISLLNFPSRISFRVPSLRDSKMILESSGAEILLGTGNALINIPSIGKIEQIHVDLITDEDILNIVNEVKKKSADMLKNEKKNNIKNYNDTDCLPCDNYNDPLYDDVVDFAMEFGKISATLIQRKYRIGYNRAARLIDLMEEKGIIGPQVGSEPRKVLKKYDDNN